MGVPTCPRRNAVCVRWSILSLTIEMASLAALFPLLVSLFLLPSTVGAAFSGQFTITPALPSSSSGSEYLLQNGTGNPASVKGPTALLSTHNYSVVLGNGHTVSWLQPAAAVEDFL